MLPNDFEIKKEERKEYPLLPKNVYQVELLSIDLADAKGKFAKPGEKNFVFQFTLLAGKDKDADLRGRNLWNNFVHTALFIGKKGKCNLWEIVEALIGRELTREEVANGLTGAFLNSLIGKQLKVFVDQKLSGDKTFNNITSYMPADTLLPSLTEAEKEESRVKVKKNEADELAEASAKADEIITSIPF